MMASTYEPKEEIKSVLQYLSKEHLEDYNPNLGNKALTYSLVNCPSIRM